MKHNGPSPLPANPLVCAIVAAVLGSLSAGCATTAQCNPARDQGLFRTISCTPRYSERLEERRSLQANESAEHQRLNASLNQTAQAGGKVDNDLRLARGNVADLQRRLDAVTYRVNTARGGNTRITADIRRLQGRITNLGGAGGGGSQTELAALRKDLAEKEAAVATLAK